MILPETLKNCNCGKTHSQCKTEVFKGSGALSRLGEAFMLTGGKKAFVVCDKNTYKAAGQRVCEILSAEGIDYTLFVFNTEKPKPCEETVGSAFMHLDSKCNVIIGVGSGVINDTCKILSNVTGKKYIIVATAPSMDGYSSATSSLEMDGLKVSLNSRSADIIIGDTDILKNAPLHMLKSGLGDMLAKYESICEWRISHLVTGEYYCENVAQLVREALEKCTDNAEKLLLRDETAVEAVFDGLILTGTAMNYAGASRPASGMEHYFSHLWDMRSLEFGTPADSHGIQCGIGTLYGAKLYDEVRKIRPSAEKGLEYAAKFDLVKWQNELRIFLGKGADTIIKLEQKENKYSTEEHKKRIAVITEKWDEILRIIEEEMPGAQFIQSVLEKIQAPQKASDIGIPDETVRTSFMVTKDIRDKYILSKLLWDMGILEEFADKLVK